MKSKVEEKPSKKRLETLCSFIFFYRAHFLINFTRSHKKKNQIKHIHSTEHIAKKTVERSSQINCLFVLMLFLSSTPPAHYDSNADPHKKFR